jgi:hypothetical protein
VALLGLSTFLAAGGWDLKPEEELAEALKEIPLASTFTSVPIIAFTTAFLTGIGLVLLIPAVLGFIMTWGPVVGQVMGPNHHHDPRCHQHLNGDL